MPLICIWILLLLVIEMTLEVSSGKYYIIKNWNICQIYLPSNDKLYNQTLIIKKFTQTKNTTCSERIE